MNSAAYLVIPLLAIACRSSTAIPPAPSATDAKSEQPQTEYEIWIRAYRAGPLKARFYDESKQTWDDPQVKLVITAIEGERQKMQAPLPSETSFDTGMSSEFKYGCAL